jgi:membrane-bound serine protease (ClpP class)
MARMTSAAARVRIRLALSTVAFAACLSLCAAARGASADNSDDVDRAAVWVVELEGAISPATADYFIHALNAAEKAHASALIIRLDTPGGLDQSMRAMIKAILASSIPVVTYVSPNGSRAASAGTYILYASHFAAMAPATNVGSSTPVSIGGPAFPSPGGAPAGPKKAPDEDKDKSANKDDEAHDKEPAGGEGGAMERKVLNDAVAYIRGLAALRGRNVEWAEKTVREAANLTAADALAQHVIEAIAPDLDALLAILNGKTFAVSGGSVTLDLTNATVHRVEPGLRYQFLSLITDPNVAYILLMIGIYGLLLEFYNPGTGVPGVTGVICLLLAAYALQMLPVNYAGLALIVVGIGLMVAEAFTPTLGVLGVGGGIAFVIGSIILMDTDLPGYRVSVPLIAAIAATTVGLFVFAIGAAMRARKKRVTTGREAMVGAPAVALADFDGEGFVRAFGENWRAATSRPLRKDQRLRIKSVEGLLLTVEPEE